MKWKIDKDVKIPPSYSSRNSQYREIIADMEEGDSVGELTQSQANGMAHLMRKNGINAVSRKMTGSKVDITEPVYRVWHDGLLETAEEQGKQRIGSPIDTVGIDPGILQQAEAHEDKHNIVEDTREVLKIANEELAEIKKKEKGK
jgi:hypothetical protein